MSLLPVLVGPPRPATDKVRVTRTVFEAGREADARMEVVRWAREGPGLVDPEAFRPGLFRPLPKRVSVMEQEVFFGRADPSQLPFPLAGGFLASALVKLGPSLVGSRTEKGAWDIKWASAGAETVVVTVGKRQETLPRGWTGSFDWAVGSKSGAGRAKASGTVWTDPATGEGRGWSLRWKLDLGSGRGSLELLDELKVESLAD